MADNSIDWEKLDADRMALALQEIRGSENLRFFFRSLLTQFGVTATPDGQDSLSMARAVGFHAAGTYLLGVLEEYEEGFFGHLLVEDAAERKQRSEGNY